MLITREIDYAVRIVRDLSAGGRRKIDEICKNELIPRQFSYKILKKLEQAGIVKIFRGAGGGYSLVKEPNNLTLLDIVTSINSEFLITECLAHGYECPMDGKDGKPCHVHTELERVQNQVLDLLKENPLSALC